MSAEEKRVVLVVEDDRHLRETIVEALTDDGFEVAAAVDGQDALHWLSVTPEPPKVIIMDLLMPNMNGWELRHRLYTEHRWRTIPVVVLSSALDVRAWPEGEMPAHQFRKPPILDALLKMIGEIISTRDASPTRL